MRLSIYIYCKKPNTHTHTSLSILLADRRTNQSVSPIGLGGQWRVLYFPLFPRVVGRLWIVKISTKAVCLQASILSSPCSKAMLSLKRRSPTFEYRDYFVAWSSIIARRGDSALERVRLGKLTAYYYSDEGMGGFTSCDSLPRAAEAGSLPSGPANARVFSVSNGSPTKCANAGNDGRSHSSKQARRITPTW